MLVVKVLVRDMELLLRLLFGLNLAWHWQLWTCTFYESLWDSLLLVHVIEVACVC